jgi:hypothetical protein
MAIKAECRQAISTNPKRSNMREAVVRVSALAIALLLIAGSYARAQSPIPITACETITKKGTYALANDLVAPFGSDCLVISSPHVTIDMSGWAIIAACPSSEPLCPPIELGGVAVQITSGADHVSILSLTVQKFATGLVTEADYTSVVGASLFGSGGISLNNVSHSTFTDVSYSPADPHIGGTILSVNGGGHNTFTFVSGAASSGIIITNSSHNVIEGADNKLLRSDAGWPGDSLNPEFQPQLHYK